MNDERTIFVDLDGVLVDFDGGFKRIFRMSPSEFQEKHGKGSEMRKTYSRGKEFWSNLDWIEGGKELWEFIKNNFLYIKILSSSGSSGKIPDWQPIHNMVYSGKLEWIQKNLPDLDTDDVIIVPTRKVKAKYAKTGDVLVDDHNENINDWIAAGGIGVIHSSPYYRTTIKQLGEYV